MKAVDVDVDVDVDVSELKRKIAEWFFTDGWNKTRRNTWINKSE